MITVSAGWVSVVSNMLVVNGRMGIIVDVGEDDTLAGILIVSVEEDVVTVGPSKIPIRGADKVLATAGLVIERTDVGNKMICEGR